MSTLLRNTSLSDPNFVERASFSSPSDRSACTRALKLRTPRPRLRLRQRECCGDTMARHRRELAATVVGSMQLLDANGAIRRGQKVSLPI